MIRYAAPGRINLIGEHTDYNQGFALPIALPERTEVAFEPDAGDVVVVHSDREAGEVAIPLGTEPGDVAGWAAYVAGVIWALATSGHRVSGGTMAVSSGVEMGSGLASSAALECAALGALAVAADLQVDRTGLARIAQRAETEYVGAPTGLMDQLASMCGEPRRALMIDFLDASIRTVPFDPGAAGIGLVLINSHAPHHHAGGEYAARRASCERAAAALGVRSLRDVQDRPDTILDDIADPLDARRARHILTENRRVGEVVSALGASDFAAVGEIFCASHDSMRVDFEITTEHIDLIADTAVQAGALGARMTGGGFGGCVIALAPLDRCAVVGDAVRHAVERAGFAPPTIELTEAGAGAGPAGSRS